MLASLKINGADREFDTSKLTLYLHPHIIEDNNTKKKIAGVWKGEMMHE